MGQPTIPAGATITAATMTVNIVSGTSTAYNAKASQITGTWESGTIQWSNMPTIGDVLEDNISHNNKTKYQFSCLAAVQHWYDGSTTGQNENYGIMLQYADDTVADYNSFYSADCTDATMRPSMTISYTPPSGSYSVNEGETLTLPIARATGTITWTSSDSTVATVNSNGVVTGIKAGVVTITAFLNGAEYHSFTVYVTVVNGVYRICYGTDYYLGTSGGVTNNTSVHLTDYASSEVDLLRQLWKITYLGDGYYSPEEHLLPIVQMFYNDPNNEIESMALNLAHEVAHTLGLKEIYNNAYDDDSIVNGTPWHDNDETGMCIMKSYATIDVSDLYRQTLAGEASALCDYCIGKLHTEAIQDRDLYES